VRGSEKDMETIYKIHPMEGFFSEMKDGRNRSVLVSLVEVINDSDPHRSLIGVRN
jgi:hypothetical protein